MTRILVCSITGASASSRKRGKTLPAFLENVLSEMPDIEAEFKNIYSSENDCVEKLVISVMSGGYDLVLLVGKSLGAVRVWWSLNRYWNHYKLKQSKCGTKIGVVLIDAHGPQRGDGKIGSYGKRLRKLPYLPDWKRDDIRFHAIYQQNKYPEGVKLRTPEGELANHGRIVGNVENTKLSSFADHWSITDIGTLAGRQVATAIQKMIGWLINED